MMHVEDKHGKLVVSCRQYNCPMNIPLTFNDWRMQKSKN